MTSGVPDPEREGGTIDSEILETNPMVVQALLDEEPEFRAVDVCAGDSISVALAADGQLRAWGSFRVCFHCYWWYYIITEVGVRWSTGFRTTSRLCETLLHSRLSPYDRQRDLLPSRMWNRPCSRTDDERTYLGLGKWTTRTTRSPNYRKTESERITS